MFVAIETARKVRVLGCRPTGMDPPSHLPSLPQAPRMVAEVFECTVGQKPSRAPFYLNDPAEVLQLMARMVGVHLNPTNGV